MLNAVKHLIADRHSGDAQFANRFFAMLRMTRWYKKSDGYKTHRF